MLAQRNVRCGAGSNLGHKKPRYHIAAKLWRAEFLTVRIHRPGERKTGHIYGVDGFEICFAQIIYRVARHTGLLDWRGGRHIEERIIGAVTTELATALEVPRDFDFAPDKTVVWAYRQLG